MQVTMVQGNSMSFIVLSNKLTSFFAAKTAHLRQEKKTVARLFSTLKCNLGSD
jgi:hypothetical protein